MTGKKYDIAIIGGGPGGYTAAIRARQLGFTVALIEKQFLGGTCLNIGCIPTKALEKCASLYEEVKKTRQFGINVPEAGFDWTGVQKYKNRCVIRLRKGVESLMKKNEIDVLTGHGSLAGVDSIDIDGMQISAENIIIATGSRAGSLPTLPVDGVKVLTSDHALDLKNLPGKLLIVGAGTIGCEFAYIMSSFGVDVTMVEFLDRALPMEDEDISAEYGQHLKRRKVKLHVSSSVERIESVETGITAHVKPRDGSDEFTVDVDRVLVSIGRAPVTEKLGLEIQGVPMEEGYIQVDGRLHTGVGNIRAIGDAVGGLMLAHKAAAEGILAVDTIAGKTREPIVEQNIPRGTYTRPAVASVGLNESEARDWFDGDISVGKYPFSALGKAVIAGEGSGFVKWIAGGDKAKLVGAHVIGGQATDLIAVAATAIGAGLTAESFVHIVQAHPTLGEVWKEAAHGLLEGTINY